MLLGCLHLPQKSGEKKMFKHPRISLIRPQRTLSILIIENLHVGTTDRASFLASFLHPHAFIV